jgi:hypothetical protein
VPSAAITVMTFPLSSFIHNDVFQMQIGILACLIAMATAVYVGMGE